MLADLTPLESAGILASMLFGGLGVLTGAAALFKKQDVQISNTPLTVEVAERCVVKEDFQKHVDLNERQHAGLFAKISGVERGANSSLDQKMEIVRKDVLKIAQEVATLRGETTWQNQQLARMDAKLDRLAERK
jgi:hypothetical protein